MRDKHAEVMRGFECLEVPEYWLESNSSIPKHDLEALPHYMQQYNETVALGHRDQAMIGGRMPLWQLPIP
eukprot:scaffold185551_cov16-Tisochrysis_lutea.AAC.2